MIKSRLLLLFLIGFLLYVPSFWNQFVWDDEQFIYRNTYVRNFELVKIWSENTIAGAGEVSNYYRPLTTLSFAIDHLIWGLRPFGFHVTNTLLHVLSGLLLYVLLKKLKLFETTFDWEFAIALLFLIHPLQTEAVTYINSRGDSLYTFFVMLGLVSFSWLIETVEESAVKVVNILGNELRLTPVILSIASGLFYLAGILSKEIAIAALGLYGVILFAKLLGEGFSFRKLSRWKLVLGTWCVLVGIAGGYLVLRATVLNFNNSFNFYDAQNIYTENLHVRLITFTHIFFEYLRLLVIPFPLHMERNPVIHTNIISIPTISFIILIVLLAVVSLWEWRKKNSLTIGLGVAWFMVMMAPVSGLIPINGLMYEHWLYVPMIGFWVVVFKLAEWLYLLLRTKQQQLLTQQGAVVIGVIGGIIFSFLTLRQNYIWRNPVAFYEYTLQYADSIRLHNNLAMAYSDAQRPQDAIREYKKAIEIQDVYPQPHYNLARTYIEMNDLENAERELLRALEMSPQFYFTHTLLLDLYIYQKRYPEAIRLVDVLLAEEPANEQLLQLKNNLQRQK